MGGVEDLLFWRISWVRQLAWFAIWWGWGWLVWRFNWIWLGWAGDLVVFFGDFVALEILLNWRIGWVWLDIWLCWRLGLVGNLAGWIFGWVLNFVGLKI